ARGSGAETVRRPELLRAVVPLVLQPVAPGRSARRSRGALGHEPVEGHLRVRVLRTRDGAGRLLRRAGARRGNVLPRGLRSKRQLAIRGDAVTIADSSARSRRTSSRTYGRSRSVTGWHSSVTGISNTIRARLRPSRRLRTRLPARC